MNHLNSVLLEGEVRRPDKPDTIEVVSRNYTTTPAGVATEETVIPIVADTAEVLETMVRAVAGQGVRLSGRLAQKIGLLIVVADHVDLRPLRAPRQPELGEVSG